MEIGKTKEGEPQAHSCSRGNFSNAIMMLKLYEFKNWRIEISDYYYDHHNKTTVIKEPKYIGFCNYNIVKDKYNGMREGKNISFHQPTLDFEKAFGDMLRYLENQGCCERIGEKQPELLPTDRHRKKAYALGKQYPKNADPFRCIIPQVEYVEVVNGTKKWQIRYDISDHEWKRQTGWES